ncbi:MAG: Nucleolar protein 58 [Cirrosporium novae-zelandiae]|nr:MAG: Nucleolar protein 58 [Cirrosporium novae-zelandiae]
MAPLFILTETSAGYALLKAKDKKLLKRDDLASKAEDPEEVCSLLKLKVFQKFDSSATALEEASALVEGKVSSKLASLLDSLKDEKKASLVVADPKLGNAINNLPGFSITPISDSTTTDVYRAIRANITSLIPQLLPEDISTLNLGLSHSLSRHKLKFSPDKIDTMIIQAIGLLDDLDKELNTYAMRVKEWYGWHFPEMGKIVNDNIAYAKIILAVGMRHNMKHTDLGEILPEEIEVAIKHAAELSMGTEITEEDLDNIRALAEQVVGFTEYRQQLSSYLTSRMTAIAPNLTTLVGELVGARLIAHAGSLLNLSKSPASTIQILGAEKALFRALKTKHDTPKYGLIYHASLIGQATGKNKGKMARMLAAKAAIGLRVDALAEWGTEQEGAQDVDDEKKAELGVESRIKLERKLASLEGKPLRPKGVAIGPNGIPVQPGKWEIKEARKYNPDADGMAGDEVAPKAAKKLIEEVKDTEMASASEAEESTDEEMPDAEEKTPSSDTAKEPSPVKSKSHKEAKVEKYLKRKEEKKKHKEEKKEKKAKKEKKVKENKEKREKKEKKENKEEKPSKEEKKRKRDSDEASEVKSEKKKKKSKA